MSQARADPSRNEIPQEQRPRVLAAAILNNLLRRRQVLRILLQQRRKLQLMGTAAPLTDLHRMRALQHAPVLPNEVQRAHARRCRQHWMRAKKLAAGGAGVAEGAGSSGGACRSLASRRSWAKHTSSRCCASANQEYRAPRKHLKASRLTALSRQHQHPHEASLLPIPRQQQYQQPAGASPPSSWRGPSSWQPWRQSAPSAPWFHTT